MATVIPAFMIAIPAFMIVIPAKAGIQRQYEGIQEGEVFCQMTPTTYTHSVVRC